MLIARHELEDLCHEGLKAKHAAMIFDLANSDHPVEDRKMANGQMLYASMSSWTNDRLLLGHN